MAVDTVTPEDAEYLRELEFMTGDQWRPEQVAKMMAAGWMERALGNAHRRHATDEKK